MALGGKVDDKIRIILRHQFADQRAVADVALNEDVTLVVHNALEVLQIAGIGQLIKIHDADILILVQHVVYEVGSDEAGAAGDKIGFHDVLLFPLVDQWLDF